MSLLKNKLFVFSISVLFVLFLVACGDSDKSETNASEKEVDELSYSQVEEITSEDGFLHNLQIDESGEVVLFGKGEQGNEHPMVYVDGEITELNTDYYDMHSYMTRHGVVSGYSTEDHEEYTYHFHDARSGEETEYTVEQEFITMTFRTNYIENDDGTFEEILRTKTPQNQFELDFVHLADDTFEEINLTEYVEDYTESGRFDSPHAFYSPDADKVYVLVHEDTDADDTISSMHVYDIETGDIEAIGEIPDYFTLADYNSPFVDDGDSILMLSNQSELYKLELDSGEFESLDKKDLTQLHVLDGNKYAWLNRDTGEVNITSLDNDESEVVHTIDNLDDRRIKKFSMSKNGNTFAYTVEDSSGEDTTHHLEILTVD